MCSKCGAEKHGIDDFYVGQARCKECSKAIVRARTAAKGDEINAKRRARRQNDPEHRARLYEIAKNSKSRHPEAVRARNVKATHGITLEEYDEYMRGPCGICGGLAAHLDHDHATGFIRGPLCGHCNLMLGHAKDDPTRLAAGIAYLEASAAKQAGQSIVGGG